MGMPHHQLRRYFRAQLVATRFSEGSMEAQSVKPCLLPWRWQVVHAWAALLAAAPAVGELETFRYDLVDVARQALSKRATAMWRVRCSIPSAKP